MTIIKHDKVLLERFGEETLAFDMRNNIPYILNPLAANIFSLAIEKIEPEEIAARLCQMYEIDFQSAVMDVKKVLADLFHKKILTTARE